MTRLIPKLAAFTLCLLLTLGAGASALLAQEDAAHEDETKPEPIVLPVRVRLTDALRAPVINAEVTVNGAKVSIEQGCGCYVVRMTFPPSTRATSLTIEISHPVLADQKRRIEVEMRHPYVSVAMWKPDQYVMAGDEKSPVERSANTLLVKLAHTPGLPPETARKLMNSIAGDHGLQVVRQYHEPPLPVFPVGPRPARAAGDGSLFALRRADAADFPPGKIKSLAALRSDSRVVFAGPLLRSGHDISGHDVPYALLNTIVVGFEHPITQERALELLQKHGFNDALLYFSASYSTHYLFQITLDPGTGWAAVDLAEKLLRLPEVTSVENGLMTHPPIRHTR